MQQNTHSGRWLIVIVIIVALAVWIDLPGTPSVLGREVGLRQGLDLQGGVQVLLEADLAPGQEVEIRGHAGRADHY